MELRISKPRKNFTLLPNEIIRDKRLKSTDKVVLMTLYSLHPSFDFNLKGFAKCCNLAKSTVEKSMKHLDECGYLSRTRIRDAHGRCVGSRVEVFEKSIVKEEKTKKEQDIVNQDVVKQAQYNTNNTNKTTNNREALSDSEYQSLVAEFGHTLVDEQIAKVKERHYQGCMNHETIRKWCTERKNRNMPKITKNSFLNFNQREYDNDELKRLLLTTDI